MHTRVSTALTCLSTSPKRSVRNTSLWLSAWSPRGSTSNNGARIMGHWIMGLRIICPQPPPPPHKTSCHPPLKTRPRYFFFFHGRFEYIVTEHGILRRWRFQYFARSVDGSNILHRERIRSFYLSSIIIITSSLLHSVLFFLRIAWIVYLLYLLYFFKKLQLVVVSIKL